MQTADHILGVFKQNLLSLPKVKKKGELWGVDMKLALQGLPGNHYSSKGLYIDNLLSSFSFKPEKLCQLLIWANCYSPHHYRNNVLPLILQLTLQILTRHLGITVKPQLSWSSHCTTMHIYSVLQSLYTDRWTWSSTLPYSGHFSRGINFRGQL